jgi:hypothetical protein
MLVSPGACAQALGVKLAPARQQLIDKRICNLFGLLRVLVVLGPSLDLTIRLESFVLLLLFLSLCQKLDAVCVHGKTRSGVKHILETAALGLTNVELSLLSPYLHLTSRVELGLSVQKLLCSKTRVW